MGRYASEFICGFEWVAEQGLFAKSKNRLIPTWRRKSWIRRKRWDQHPVDLYLFRILTRAAIRQYMGRRGVHLIFSLEFTIFCVRYGNSAFDISAIGTLHLPNRETSRCQRHAFHTSMESLSQELSNDIWFDIAQTSSIPSKFLCPQKRAIFGELIPESLLRRTHPTQNSYRLN